MVTSGAPRCPYCGADLGWGEGRCPYCGSSLLPRSPAWPGALIGGPFPRQLRVERKGLLRASHHLYDDEMLLGTFTQRWPAGIRFLSTRGYRYRTRRKRLLRLVLHWTCGPDLVAWVEQSRFWIRRYRLHYGGNRYWLTSASPMSLHFLLSDEAGGLLAELAPGRPIRHQPPTVTVYAPVTLEVVALAYATALVLWRQAATA
ncbi:MAG: hypothetical protein ACP5OO_12260 [Chloroflexia bacterium]